MPGPALAALLIAALPLAPPAGPAVVLVTAGDSYGAGVVWDAPGGLVLTALHVVEGAPEVRVSLGGARAEPARVVDVDPGLDLALLASAPLERGGRATAAPTAASLRGAVDVRLRAAGAAPGDRVRLLGFPRLRAAEVSGVVVDPARAFAGARYVEIAGQAEPGASGGPVVDAAGEVVGIVDLVLADRGVTLAVPIALAAARFPRRPPDAAGTPPAVAAAGGPPTVSASARRATSSPAPRAD